MSHFSVLVVGNVDYNMAPFHEFECDGVDDEFVQTIDITDRYKADYHKALEDQKKDPNAQYGFKGKTFKEYLQDYCGLHFAESPNSLDLEGEHKYGYFYAVGEDDFKVFDRTNPNKFYDYYGSGYKAFKLKKPIKDINYRTGEEEETFYTNQAKVKDIDFEGKWAEEEKKARELYRKIVAALGYTPSLEHTWASLVDQFYPEDGKEPTLTRDKASEIYESQKAVKDFAKLFEDKKLDRYELGIFSKVDDFCMTEDEYVKSQSIHSLSFGYVVNREYHSRGDMGWWACVSNEKDPVDWDTQYQEFIKSLNPEDELTMLDCHI